MDLGILSLIKVKLIMVLGKMVKLFRLQRLMNKKMNINDIYTLRLLFTSKFLNYKFIFLILF